MPLRRLTAALRRGPFRTPAPIAAPTQKSSATSPLIALHAPGQPIWSPRDYAAFSREGYAKNPLVYRAIRMVAEAAASIPVHLFDHDRRLSQHPLLDLLAQPNATCCGPDLLEDWYGYLLIAGNAYMEAVSVGGAVRELHVLRPDRMKVIAGGDGWPSAYEYTANGVSVRFAQAPDEGVRPILHMALFNPSNDYYGMSPIEAAASAIDLHNAASG
jgi:HK97 family phage portal protein